MALSDDTHYAQLHLPTGQDNWCPPEGPLTAKIAFIGEAPGQQERRLRRPFCGPSGQLLDQALRSTGISRSDCYITNVIKEQPPKNDISGFLDLSKRIPREGGRWTYYLNLLQRELDATIANVFVAVGAVSLYALTGKTGISKQRGSILECSLIPGKKVIPILHPAAALRQYLFTHYIRIDLKRIKRESEFLDIRRPQRDLILNPDFSQILSFLQHFHATCPPYTELDIEVLNEEISCLCIGSADYGTLCIPLIDERGDIFSPEQEIEIWDSLARLLEDPAVQKLGQNITFDATFIFRKLGIRTFPVLDTMVAQGISYPELPKGLDFLTSVYANEPYYKDDGKKWFKLGGSFSDLWLYNAKDGAVLPEIHTAQIRELTRQKNLLAYQNQLRLIEPLVYLQERGILCDRDGLAEASKLAETQISELTEQLHSICGFPLNPSSPKQLAEYFYGTKKFKPYLDRKTGNVTTNRDALKRLARKGSLEASLLLKLRKLGKLKGTYLDISLDPDSRLRCSFNPVGTSSGRLSSSKTIFGTGGNLQNLPSEFKRFLHFDPGYYGYQIDLSQAENRCVAYIAPDELMIRAFEDGLDVHSLTGALISGLSYDEVKYQDDKNICCEIGGGLYTWRFWGKKANHGLNYDLGFRTFAFYYEIPERDAQYIVERYHRAYPGVRQYHAAVRAKLSQGRILENCLGRKRIFLDRWSDELFKEAYSFNPQSTVADKLNQHGLIPAYYEDQYHEVDLLNQVHDSIVFQIPKHFPLSLHVEILMSLRESLESPINWDGRSFSIPADIEAVGEGGNFGKYKKGDNDQGLHKVSGRTYTEILSSLSSIIEQSSLSSSTERS
jgi:uracil-DNA glycosylase family 4